MAGKKLKKKELNKRILDVSEGWTAPFPHDSQSNAKAAVLAKIGNVAQQSETLELLPEERRSPKVIRINHLTWSKLAASVALLVCIPYAVWLFGNETQTNGTAGAFVCELPDGSKVTLAKGATVEYNQLIWAVNRRVSLSGDGYFEVESGSQFRVITPAGQVRVMGTSFSVWSSGESLLVHCASGKVAVEMNGSELALEAGEFTRRKTEGDLSKKQKFAAEGAIFPENKGFIHCDDLPLGMVLAQIEHATDVVIYSDLSESLRYSGTLDLSRTNECLELVCKPYGAKFERNAEGYVTIRQ
jgi:ferric-dicitrate binding protein FerR (iron transport regulator)